MTWVYVQSERREFGGLWTVGFYDPSGNFQPESDHGAPEAAASRVHFLNGGKGTEEAPDYRRAVRPGERSVLQEREGRR